MQQVKAEQPKVIVAIQYLRGVAALMVVWHHATNQVPGMAAFVPWGFGVSGVDLFFVISGFIMVVTTSGTAMGPTQFWRRRIARVVPIYWLLTLLMVGIAFVAPSLFKTLKVEPLKLVQSLLFIPHFSASFPGFAWPVLVPGWTLNFEMFFYAVFGASLVLPMGTRLAAMTAIFVGLAAIGLAFGPFESAMARTYTSPMLLEFVAGAWIGARWLKGHWPLSFRVSLLLVTMGTALLVLRDHEPFGAYVQCVGATCVVIGALNPNFSAWRSRALQAIGDSSYSLYLTHIFTLGAVRVVFLAVIPLEPSPVTVTAFMTCALLVCSVVGWLAYRWVEKPLLRLSSGASKPPHNAIAVASGGTATTQAPASTGINR